MDLFLLVFGGAFVGAAFGYIMGWRAATRRLSATLLTYRLHDPHGHERLTAWWRRKDIDGHG